MVIGGDLRFDQPCIHSQPARRVPLFSWTIARRLAILFHPQYCCFRLRHRGEIDITTRGRCMHWTEQMGMVNVFSQCRWRSKGYSTGSLYDELMFSYYLSFYENITDSGC